MTVFRLLGVAGSVLALMVPADISLAETPVLAITQPVFKPTSGWLVGPAAIVPSGQDAAGDNLPCVMANQFDNGYIVRLSGGSGRLMAMALDFRQKVFTPRKSYEAVLSVPPSYSVPVAALAHNDSTLIFNLREQREVYDALRQGREMVVAIGEDGFRFSMDGAQDGLDRIEYCYRQARGEPSLPEPVMIDRPEHRIAASPDEPPLPPTARGEGIRFAAQEISPPVPPQLPARKEGQADRENGVSESSSMDKTREGREGGAPIPRILFISPGAAQAAETSGKQTPSAQPAPAQEAAENAGTKEAVAPLSIDATLKFAENRVTSVDASASDADAPQLQEDARPGVPVWRASRNENARSVLQRWAEQEGVSLVWSARGDAKVSQDFRFEGPFDEAVAAFLRSAGPQSGLYGHFEGGSELVSAPASSQAANQPNSDAVMARAVASIEPSSGESAKNGGQDVSGEGRWRAPKGADVRNVLELWARQSSVDLLWEGDESFPVRQSLSLQGDFPAAVRSLLEQYDEDAVRPVGRLYRDPQTGRYTLALKAERES